MPTVLITGCSSGFGLATARHFLDHGWRVVATMRQPRSDVLPASDQVRVLPLDVRDQRSIGRAIETAGPVDVLVNNAGFGAAAPLECMSRQSLEDLFATNTLGVMSMTQAVLPQFRHRRSGVVVNISSNVTMKRQPLLSAYRASKAAVNAFTDSLAAEVEPFGVRVHLVIPGHAPETAFRQNALHHMEGREHEAYAETFRRFFATGDSGTVTHPEDVVAAVWRAATDPACPQRLLVGADLAPRAGEPDPQLTESARPR